MISCRSTPGSLGVSFLDRRVAQLVVAGAIGRRLDRQRQGRRGRHWPGRVNVALARQDVEYDVAAEELGRKSLGAGCLDRVETGLGNRSQNVDELAVAVAMAGQPTPDLRQCRRQVPVAK